MQFIWKSDGKISDFISFTMNLSTEYDTQQKYCCNVIYRANLPCVGILYHKIENVFPLLCNALT